MNPVTDWTEPDLPERQGPAAYLVSGLSGLSGPISVFGTSASIPAKAIVDENGVVIVDKNGVDIVSI